MSELLVEVHYWMHPTWDMELITEANEHSRSYAEDMLASDATEDDRALLTYREGQMSRAEFENLPEWDG